MLPPPKLDLVPALMTLCDDAFFAIAAAGRLDTDVLHALAARRAGSIRSAALGVATVMPGKPVAELPPHLEAWDDWLRDLCAAIAPIVAPKWMPMAELVEGGLSLEYGARGVRSLFTSKPSEKEIARVHTLGRQAARALGAVLGSAGSFSGDARLVRGAFLASLGLPEEDRNALDAEEPPATDALDLTGGFDAKLARGLVRGAFFAAMGDGLDPREEQAVQAIARKLDLAAEDVNAARTEARAATDAARALGEASVDAIRYVLGEAANTAPTLAIAAARLLLPTALRREALTAINVGGAVTLGRKYTLDRRRREAALGLAWTAAMRGDPTATARAAYAVRHDRMAADLGGESEGREVRDALDSHFDKELCAVIVAAG